MPENWDGHIRVNKPGAACIWADLGEDCFSGNIRNSRQWDTKKVCTPGWWLGPHLHMGCMWVERDGTEVSLQLHCLLNCAVYTHVWKSARQLHMVLGGLHRKTDANQRMDFSLRVPKHNGGRTTWWVSEFSSFSLLVLPKCLYVYLKVSSLRTGWQENTDRS